MRTLTTITFSALLLTACGTGTPGTAMPATSATAADKTLTAQAYESTWAGGRCWFRQYFMADGGSHYEVKHLNNGYVRLKMDLINWPGPAEVIEKRYHAQMHNIYAAEVSAWCKIDGQWVGGVKYRTN